MGGALRGVTSALSSNTQRRVERIMNIKLVEDEETHWDATTGQKLEGTRVREAMRNRT